MQYILTEQEYRSLKEAIKQSSISQKQILQDLCTKVCDHMPILFGNNDHEKPWGCIHTRQSGEHYCDECPVERVCPEEDKTWSK